MRAHKIENGVVSNTIEVESLDFMPGLIDASNGGTIGDMWDGEKFIAPTVPTPTISEKMLELKTDFLGYLTGHYDLGTQSTIQMAFMNPDSSDELKDMAKDVGDWILSVQRYYKSTKTEIIAGNVGAEWDFLAFDDTKPAWDFDDFV